MTWMHWTGIILAIGLLIIVGLIVIAPGLMDQPLPANT